jgi:hypothetical protein
LLADGLIDMHPSGARLTFTDKGARKFCVMFSAACMPTTSPRGPHHAA